MRTSPDYATPSRRKHKWLWIILAIVTTATGILALALLWPTRPGGHLIIEGQVISSTQSSPDIDWTKAKITITLTTGKITDPEEVKRILDSYQTQQASTQPGQKPNEVIITLDSGKQITIPLPDSTTMPSTRP